MIYTIIIFVYQLDHLNIYIIYLPIKLYFKINFCKNRKNNHIYK